MSREAPFPRLGEFEILGRIGRGTMGTVYRARQPRLDRVVALKVLAAHLTANADFVRRFLKEARLAAQLSHPNIVRVYDVAQSAGTHYIAMEYVPGRSLEHLTRSGTTLSESRALSVARQMADALKHAAAKGIVHRDIKPGNIILTPDRVPKLTDLGLAVAAGQTPEDGVGTPFYISPEQARNDPRIDVRSDVYSLGCTLFHAVTGRVPYAGVSALETIKLHASAPVADARTLRPDLSPPFAELLKKMMAKRPEDRFATPDDLIAAVKAVAAGRPLRARKPRTPWLLLIAVAAALILLLIVLLLVLKIAAGRQEDAHLPFKCDPRPRSCNLKAVP